MEGLIGDWNGLKMEGWIDDWSGLIDGRMDG